MSNSGTKVYAAGELLVTGHGEVIIDEIVPKSRALFVHPDHYVHVHFDPSEPLPPPCAGDDVPDQLKWDLVVIPVTHPKHHHHHKHHHNPNQPPPEDELRLKIDWRVGTARTVLWKIHVPV